MTVILVLTVLWGVFRDSYRSLEESKIVLLVELPGKVDHRR